MPPKHTPVLIKEVLSFLPAAGLVVDGTLGGGGHSRAILEYSSALSIVGLDRDPKAPGQELCHDNSYQYRFSWRHGSYANLLTLLQAAELRQVKVVLLDLGFSSIQISEADRGMAFSTNGPLDMRFDQTDLSLRTAADIINTASSTELANIIYEFGEERQSKKIARNILEQRKKVPFKTTEQLRDFLTAILPRPRKKGIHPATKTFQALRIAVNNELGELATFLDSVVPGLPVETVIIIISFHSLEDRLVKRAWRNYSLKQRDGERLTPILRCLTKKPIRAGTEEIAANVRSRSAKMRVGVRI